MQATEWEAIVLGVMDYGEADRIVTFFSLEQGKIKGLARSAKRSRKRFGGALEPFARLRLQLTPKVGLATLHGADIITIFHRIRDGLDKIGLAAYACELVDRLVPEGEPNHRLFRLLAALLDHLDQSPGNASDRRFFEINLLKVLGYQPALDRCAACDTELAGSYRFSPAFTGILCARCGAGGRTVSPRTISLLSQALHTGRFGAIRFAPAELEEAGALLDAAIAPHLTRPLNSIAFLREICG